MDQRVVDISEKTFGRLFVKSFAGINTDRKAMWLCKCSCGNEITTLGKSLRKGLTQSCGCLQKERAHLSSYKHGHAGKWKSRGTPEYETYKNAKQRCTNPKVEHYKDYGGRGIKFLFKNFEQFFTELGLRPSDKHSVDRINNDGHYEPGNVRWATREEQQANTRTSLKDKV